MRADDYALSEETKRLRDREQRAITDGAYTWALRAVAESRVHLDRLAQALLERETLTRPEVDAILVELPPLSDAAGDVGVALDPPDVVAAPR
jgi:ATP-dependent Zn protease